MQKGRPKSITSQRAKIPRWKAKSRRFLRQRILGVDDKPHRIAWGVFLGFVVAFTPTLGFQIILYLIVASILRANKISGIPWLFISNPFSAVPLYYSTWWVGNFIMSGGSSSAEGGRAAITRLLEATENVKGSLSSLFSAKYWAMVGDTLLALGYELWLGGLVVGVILGAIAYPLALRGVSKYRQHIELKRVLLDERRKSRAESL